VNKTILAIVAGLSVLLVGYVAVLSLPIDSTIHQAVVVSSFPPPPANRPIAYTALVSSTPHIFTWSSNGGATQLTNGSGESDARWSYDGTMIAYQGTTSGAIYTMNANGSNQTQLTTPPGGVADWTPDWSPSNASSALIVFSRVNPNGGGRPFSYIYTMTSSGGNQTALVGNGTNLFVSPHYNPAGNLIVFESDLNNPQDDFQLYTCDINNCIPSIQALTSYAGIAADPMWNLTGTAVVFSCAIASTGGNVNVCTVNADGSGLTQVTHFVEPIEGADPSFYELGIVFEWDDGGNGQSSPTAPAAVWTCSGANCTSPATTGQACADIGCHPQVQP
jgi:Tol biopolymer transport system component